MLMHVEVGYCFPSLWSRPPAHTSWFRSILRVKDTWVLSGSFLLPQLCREGSSMDLHISLSLGNIAGSDILRLSHVHVSWEFHLVFPVHSPGTENSQWFTSSSYALSVGLFSLCQLGSTAELFSPGAGNGICCVLICICVFRSILVVERCPWEYLASGRWLLGNASSPCF